MSPKVLLSERVPTCLAKVAEGPCGKGHPICNRCWPFSSEEDREAIKAEYNFGKDQPFCIAGGCWEVVRLSGEARDNSMCHKCYTAQPHHRDATRSRSPRRSAQSSSSTDNVADFVTEVRHNLLVWKRQAAAMAVTADRLEEVLLKIDSEREARPI